MQRVKDRYERLSRLPNVCAGKRPTRQGWCYCAFVDVYLAISDLTSPMGLPLSDLAIIARDSINSGKYGNARRPRTWARDFNPLQSNAASWFIIQTTNSLCVHLLILYIYKINLGHRLWLTNKVLVHIIQVTKASVNGGQRSTH